MTADDSDARLSGDDASQAPRSRAAGAYLLIVRSSEIAISLRFDAATKLAALDGDAAISAFRILTEAAETTGDKMKALQKLAELDTSAGIDAYRTSARSQTSFASKMQIVNAAAKLDQKAAAEILAEALAANVEQLRFEPGVRGSRSNLDAARQAADRLSEWNLQAAIDILYQLSVLPVAGDYRMAAADQIAKLEAQQEQPDGTG